MAELAQMLSVAEARQRILEHFSPVGRERVPIEAAAGRVLAAAVVAGAARGQPARMPVSADIPAGGGQPAPLALGTVARIMTGAPMPAGADAVVPVEDTDDRRERAGEPPPAQVGIRVAPT